MVSRDGKVWRPRSYFFFLSFYSGIFQIYTKAENMV